MAVDTRIIRDEELLDRLADARERIIGEIRKMIVGQDEVVEQVLISLFVGGHTIITGVPGLAKTLLVRHYRGVLDLSFKRIQFTPDLMPADITGTEIIEEDRTTGHRALQFIRGPVFANIILADEINRTPPKTQAALLEAMQEGNVTVQGTTYQLAQTVFRSGDAEPDRDGRHLSAARSAARPLYVQRPNRLSARRRRGHRRQDDDLAAGSGPATPDVRR